jgi:hypothetical protein
VDNYFGENSAFVGLTPSAPGLWSWKKNSGKPQRVAKELRRQSRRFAQKGIILKSILHQQPAVQ